MWYDTLNKALESVRQFDAIESWPLGRNIAYGENVRLRLDNGFFISVYRSDSGRYERPIVYKL